MSSPYFAKRATRSAAANALVALGAKGKRSSRARDLSSTKKGNSSAVKIEYEKQEHIITAKPNQTTPGVGNQKAKLAKRKTQLAENAGIAKKDKIDQVSIDWEPHNWREVLANLKIMRKNEDAPVDSQGCERTADESADPQTIRYQILVSLMLSAQTKDQVTFAAMERLKEYGLNINHIVETSEEQIGKLIYPVGFWKRKATFIKQATEICSTKYDSDIPGTLEGLLALPGVGPKMAHICMHVAWHQMTGIGVDTHVHRISNRLGWVEKTTKTPEGTRKALESWLPREEWDCINILLVGFGQQTCLPVGPKCGDCLNKSLCPYGRSAVGRRKQK